MLEGTCGIEMSRDTHVFRELFGRRDDASHYVFFHARHFNFQRPAREPETRAVDRTRHLLRRVFLLLPSRPKPPDTASLTPRRTSAAITRNTDSWKQTDIDIPHSS